MSLSNVRFEWTGATALIPRREHIELILSKLAVTTPQCGIHGMDGAVVARAAVGCRSLGAYRFASVRGYQLFAVVPTDELAVSFERQFLFALMFLDVVLGQIEHEPRGAGGAGTSGAAAEGHLPLRAKC